MQNELGGRHMHYSKVNQTAVSATLDDEYNTLNQICQDDTDMVRFQSCWQSIPRERGQRKNKLFGNSYNIPPKTRHQQVGVVGIAGIHWW